VSSNPFGFDSHIGNLFKCLIEAYCLMIELKGCNKHNPAKILS